MNNLETLLREWAVIEPERCRLDEATGDLAVMLRGNWKKGLTFMGEPDPERIEGGAREAIEARGWMWVVEAECWEVGENMYRACVDTRQMPHFAGNDTNPAEALLSAYLQALESEGKP